MHRLTIDHLGKRYGNGLVALDDVTLEIGNGVLGLLGANGAGKSTLMRIIATIARPSSGNVRFDGDDIAQHGQALRRVLGYLPQDVGVYPNLNAREFLSYCAALKGLSPRTSRPQIETLIEQLHLAPAANRSLGGFSGGMRQRVGIAQALLGEPQVLIVDEPTVGLDPEERANFRDLVASLAADRIVILSTHIVSDIESIAERVVVIDSGRVIADGTPDRLIANLHGRVWEATVALETIPSVRTRARITNIARRAGGSYVRALCPTAPNASFTLAAPSLEEAYLALVEDTRAA